MMMMISSEENLSRANGRFVLDNVIFEGRMINEFITNPKCQSQSYFYVVIQNSCTVLMYYFRERAVKFVIFIYKTFLFQMLGNVLRTACQSKNKSKL